MSIDRPRAPRADTAPPTIDGTRKFEFVDRLKPYRIAILFHDSSSARLRYWRLIAEAADDGWMLTTGFDLDVEKVIKQLDAGIPLRDVTVLFHNGPRPRTVDQSTRASPDSLTGGPWCVVCGQSGGLPCPNLVGAALDVDVRLFFLPGDARLAVAHVHPGHCRQKIKALTQIAKSVKSATPVVVRHDVDGKRHAT